MRRGLLFVEAVSALALLACNKSPPEASTETTTIETPIGAGDKVVVTVSDAEVKATEPVPPSAAEGWSPTEGESKAMSLLSAHDGFDCAEVEATLGDPVASLRTFVAKVQMPPTVPMRAAHCLITGHPVEAQPDMTTWVTGADTYGLFRLVLKQYEGLPPEVQAAVRKAAAAGPYADEAAKQLQ